MEKELIKQVVKVGNSAGVVLPKSWINGRASIKLIEKPLNINKDVIEILEPYLYDVQGVYLTGSYARGEQTKKSDVDVIVISNSINKKITSGKYNLEIIPFEKVKNTLEKHPIMIYPRLMEAKAIMNDFLLSDFMKIKLNKKSFRLFYEETKRVLKMDKELLELDKLNGEFIESNAVIYSSILRLRGFYLIKCILEKEKYSKKSFKKWILKNVNLDKKILENIYFIYEEFRDSKVIKEKVSISSVEKLHVFLKKEVDKYGK